MNLFDLKKITDSLPETEVIPILFIGHGSPMNAIEENEFTRGWKEIISKIPQPALILCISAHWETSGIHITAMEKSQTIHDFGGFPPELYAVNYPSPGNLEAAYQIISEYPEFKLIANDNWGLDHGTWVPLLKMYPEATIPVLQLSLNRNMSPLQHFQFAGELSRLRRKGVLIIGSGNIIHNLRLINISGYSDFNKEFAHDWAAEADLLIKSNIEKGMYQNLTDYTKMGRAVQLAVPTPEHYLPLLYITGMKSTTDQLRFFNDKIIAGSLSMTSLYISQQ